MKILYFKRINNNYKMLVEGEPVRVLAGGCAFVFFWDETERRYTEKITGLAMPTITKNSINQFTQDHADEIKQAIQNNRKTVTPLNRCALFLGGAI